MTFQWRLDQIELSSFDRLIEETLDINSRHALKRGDSHLAKVVATQTLLAMDSHTEATPAQIRKLGAIIARCGLVISRFPG